MDRMSAKPQKIEERTQYSVIYKSILMVYKQLKQDFCQHRILEIPKIFYGPNCGIVSCLQFKKILNLVGGDNEPIGSKNSVFFSFEDDASW